MQLARVAPCFLKHRFFRAFTRSRMNRNRFRLFSSDLVTIIASASCRECGSRGLLFILTHFSCAPVSAPFAPILSPSSSVPQGPSSSWARVCILSALMIRLLSELERATLFTCSVNSSWCVPHFSDFLKLCVRSQGVCLDVRFFIVKRHDGWRLPECTAVFYFTSEFCAVGISL